MEVRIETGDGMDLAQGHAQFRGQQFQLFRGQVAEFFLDGTKFWNHAPHRLAEEEEFIARNLFLTPSAQRLSHGKRLCLVGSLRLLAQDSW